MTDRPRREEIRDLRDMVESLREQLYLVQQRLTDLENNKEADVEIVDAKDYPFVASEAPPPQTPPIAPPVITTPKSDLETPVKQPPRIPTWPNRETVAKSKGDHDSQALEMLIGGTWFNRIGALVLLAGVGFLVKYAADQGWIGPLARVCTGGVVGVGLIAVGEWFVFKKKTNFAAGLLGAGIGILYFSAYAAHHFYALIDINTAFALFCGVTFVGMIASAHGRVQAIAILALLGGFWTPIALSTGKNAQVALLSYVLILDVGFMAIAAIRKWDAIRILCAAGTGILFAVWGVNYYSSDALHTTLAFLFIYYVVFHAESWIAASRPSGFFGRTIALIVNANNAVFFGIAYLLAHQKYPDLMGGMFVAGAAANWLLAWRLKPVGEHGEALRISLWIGGATLLAFFAPAQFDAQWVALTWAIQGAVTLWFCQKVESKWLFAKGIAVSVAAAVHIVMFEFQNSDMQAKLVEFGGWFINELLILTAIVTTCIYLCAFFITNSFKDDKNSAAFASAVMALGGSALLLAAFSQEFGRYLASAHWLILSLVWLVVAVRYPRTTVIPVAIVMATMVKFVTWDIIEAIESGLWKQLSGIVINPAVGVGVATGGMLLALIPVAKKAQEKIENKELIDSFCVFSLVTSVAFIIGTFTFEIVRAFRFESLRDQFDMPNLALQVTLSVFWSVSAITLLVLGFARHIRPWRLEAITLFCITLLKVVLVDLASLDMFYRIISFIALGVLLIAASWMYQRLEKSLTAAPTA